jgi:hypothetical protein
VFQVHAMRKKGVGLGRNEQPLTRASIMVVLSNWISRIMPRTPSFVIKLCRDSGF